MDFGRWYFANGDEILIQSRDEKPLNRYFPELVEPLLSQLPERCVLDGEIVIAEERRARFRCAAASPSSGGFAGEACWRSRLRRRSCSSICFARATAICGASRLSADAGSWKQFSRLQRRRFISRRRRR